MSKTPRPKERKRKSEIVTVRLDPRLKYLAELAARRQRRPLSSYIEWAVEESLSRVSPSYDQHRDSQQTFADVASELWDVDEPDRFAKLALHYPELLDHEEQYLWKLIRENGSLWRGRYGANGKWQWSTAEESLVWERLRENWKKFCSVASGEMASSVLPTWPENDPDEIPF